jgi:YD repeat-containing protein
VLGTVRTGRCGWLLGILLFGRSLAWPAAAAADVSYIYDAIGRLVGVVDPASNEAAIFTYDAVGNLTSIGRQNASTVSILDFTPSSGPAGTTVTIYGTGFSATPGSNTVSFNGASGVVASSTSTSIVATVPAGATTGPIGVTAPGGSATSSGSFTVTATDGAPVITSFSPTVASSGTTVTLTGLNFEPTPSTTEWRSMGSHQPSPR